MSIIEKHGHGGDVLTAQNLFGIPQEQFLDFSANINPLGPPESAMNAIMDNIHTIVHYPDPVHRSLCTRLAEKLGILEEKLVIGNGAAECMALVLLALQPKVVGIVYPSFSEYTTLSRTFGAKIEPCFGPIENNFKPVMSDLYQLIDKVNLVFIGQPNNPTGILYTKEELKSLAIHARNTNTYLVIDEAFIDFVSTQEKYTILDKLHHFPNVIIIRSMTKFYAIPGLRLGYSICSEEVALLLKRKQVTWSVNSLALIAGEACLQESEYEEKTIDFIESERAYLKEKFEKEFSFTVLPGTANFLLVRLPVPMTANELQSKMGQQGIMIRSCSMYPGLSEQDFRIAVRARKENNKFLDVLKKVVMNWSEVE
ncbi:MAG TPA: threonine-phosphate decarboxylase [Bacillales bacterium]|nr:threonine-phosphate decarboxylase [Bacillales bacterium]